MSVNGHVRRSFLIVFFFKHSKVYRMPIIGAHDIIEGIVLLAKGIKGLGESNES